MRYRFFKTSIFAALIACAEGRSPSALEVDASPVADAADTGDANIAVDSGPDSPDAGGTGNPDAMAPDAAIPLGDVLLITEVVDATLSGGLPKFVELTNHSAAPVNLSGYSLGVYSNGSLVLLSSVSTVLSGSLAAGQSHVVSFESSDSPGVGRFFEVYGEDPDDFGFSSQINGNDAIALFLADGTGASGAATNTGSDATLVDTYGVVGQDGLSQMWEYTDGYAARKPASVTASPTFDASAWDFSGPAALTGADGPTIAGVTSPGSH